MWPLSSRGGGGGGGKALVTGPSLSQKSLRILPKDEPNMQGLMTHSVGSVPRIISQN